MTPRRSNITRLLTKQCSSCIYIQNGRLMHLRPGRVEDMTAETIKMDTNVICHKSRSLQGELPWDAWCKGSVDKKGPGQLIRIAGRLGILEEVDPQEHYAKKGDSNE